MLSRVKGFFNFDNKSSLELVIRLAVVIVAVLVLLYSLVTLTWQLLLDDADEERLPTTVINSQGSSQAEAFDASKIRLLDLFGGTADDKAPEVAKPVEKTAVVTKLNLVLSGVMMSSNPDHSVAIISYQKKQKNYRPGAKLPGGGQVKLLEVYPDKVIISNAGRTESLLLFGKDSAMLSSARAHAPKARATKPRVDDRRKDKNTQKVLQDMRQRLKNSPASLMKIINARPYNKDGEMIGYRVSPGREAEAFSQLGFERGDVIVAVNGEAVSDPSKLMELYKLAGTAEQVSLSVLRQGQTIDLMVGLDE
ncbi:type II secretion system protein C (GspC) [Sinobacterium caligoides]|uniref:Type II secretion system protein C (GspC) n=1 Tax=Sinobacterium caligoides TaxID=933926 RepID=A0A3N2DNJ6_9GAMM|nr:type II secretion system protein C (GspC) [Sinobacterium caligoides]